MVMQISPTKGNLLALKKSLELAVTGYELLDKKRNILIRETSAFIERAKKIQNRVSSEYADAYYSLGMANLQLGVVDNIVKAAPLEKTLNINYRSIMGIDVPQLSIENAKVRNFYGYFDTCPDIDDAYFKFSTLKSLTVEFAEIQNCVFRLANGIKKTQKRANALKNIIIPRYKEQIKTITAALDEKEREEFTRLKVIKKQLETT